MGRKQGRKEQRKVGRQMSKESYPVCISQYEVPAALGLCVANCAGLEKMWGQLGSTVRPFLKGKTKHK